MMITVFFDNHHHQNFPNGPDEEAYITYQGSWVSITVSGKTTTFPAHRVKLIIERL